MQIVLRFLFICITFLSPLYLSAQVVQNFSADDTSGCTPFSTTFHDATSGGPISSYKWVQSLHSRSSGIIRLDSSTLSNPVFTFDSIGYYDITEIITSGSVTYTLTKTNYIHAYQTSVNFTSLSPASDTTLSCPDKIVNFINTTTDTGCLHEFTWSIYNNSIGADTNIYISGTAALTYTFRVPGYYNITLKENTLCSCSGSITYNNLIKIDAPPVVCISNIKDTVCHPPVTILFSSGCTTGAYSYLWHFGDGDSSTLANVSHTYTASGNYNDTLTVYSSGGCKATVWQKGGVYVRNFIAGFFVNHPFPLCGTFDNPQHVAFVDTTRGANTWLWYSSTNPYLSNVRNPVFVLNPGVHVYYDSVGDSITGCSAIIADTLTTYTPPGVAFSAIPTYRCVPNDTVTFSAIITDTFSIAQYKWAFGDGHTTSDSSYVNPATHIYYSSGSYSDTLWVKDSIGCTSAGYSSNYINIEPPKVTVRPVRDSGCAPLLVCYTTNINHPGAVFITDSVNYGDSTTTCNGNACGDSCHNYTAGGIFKLRHYYHLPAGCSYIDSVNIVVGADTPIFHPYATPDSACPNSIIYFRDSCSNCTSFYWNLGNKTSHLFNDTDQYSILGPQSITAVGDVNGCTDTLYPRLYILPPIANLYAIVGNCDSSNVIHFYSSGSTGATGFYWSFGDGGHSTLRNPIHTYTVPASGTTYTVTLVDTGGGAHHCVNSNDLQINLYPFIDTFSANDTSVCRMTSVTFTGPNTQTGSLYNEYIWTCSSSAGIVIKDTISTRRTFTYTFADTGIYDVSLKLINRYGCSDSLTKVVYVHVSGPEGGFSATPLTGCAPLLVSFHDSSSDITGIPITFRQWQFSSPHPMAGVSSALINSSGADTSYTYPEGTFKVVLIDSDANHCYNFQSKIISVQKLHAFFTANVLTTCSGKPVVFTDTNTNCSYTWSFGDGSADTGKVVTHIYSVNGTYTVSVSVIAGAGSYLPEGCIGTYTRSGYINIQNIFVNFLLSDSSAICPPLVLSANVAGRSPGYSYYWDINHIPPYTAGVTFSPTLYSRGVYTITLTDSSAAGCKDSLSKKVKIDGPLGIITESIDSGCVPLTIELLFIDTNGTSVPNITWVTGDDSIYLYADSVGIRHTYLSNGSFLPYVNITSSGCSASIYASDSIRVSPAPVISVTHPGLICFGNDTTLITIGGRPGDTYSWSPGSGLNCIDCYSVIASPTVTTTYTLTLTTRGGGCIDTAITTVSVDSALALHIGGKKHICLGKPDTLYTYGVKGNYVWMPDTALSPATHDTVIVYSIASRIYTVVATDNRGCAAIAYFPLIVDPLPIITISPAYPFVCRDSSARITANGAGPGGSYTWSPNILISDTTIADPILRDTVAMTYKVIAITSYGCIDSYIAVKVTVYDSAYTSVSNDTTICAGSSAQLIATSTSGISTYLWSPVTGLNNPGLPNPIATPDSTTLYIVKITENPCFFADRPVLVTIAPIPDIALPAGATIIAGSSIKLTATVTNSADVTQWAWTPAATLSCDTCYDPVATPTVNTTYIVTGITNIGCISQDSVQIKIICVEASQVFVPNTFTPNGDGANDRFYLSGKGLGLIRKMSVYSRWGEQVFVAENINANDPGAGWDGSYKGQQLQPDVFIYVFELVCETGVPFTLKGDISLVR